MEHKYLIYIQLLCYDFNGFVIIFYVYNTPLSP